MFELDYAARIDRGAGREASQDVARVVPRLGLALVADGEGDHAIRSAADALEEHFDRQGGPGARIDETVERLERGFRFARRPLVEHEGTLDARTGNGLVAAVFGHGHVVIGSLGRTRCYWLRMRELELLAGAGAGTEASRDGRDAISRTRSTEREESRATRRLEGKGDAEPYTRIVRPKPGDVFLLCSGGLFDHVPAPRIGALLGAAEDATEACEELAEAARARGCLEDVGVAVVRVAPMQLRLSEPSWREALSRPDAQPGGDA